MGICIGLFLLACGVESCGSALGKWLLAAKLAELGMNPEEAWEYIYRLKNAKDPK